MRDHEIICGFSIKKMPHKPDFLPISQEEFVQSTLEAWTHGDEESKVSAVFHGGVQEWAALWTDESYKVRGAVACRASEEYQLKLVCDPITPVRERLAMELEESVQNQRLVSTALLTAGNRVLWTRLNAALDCFKEFCASDPSPRVQRQYRLVYERYMAVPEKPVEDVLELLGIERTRYFTGISEATKTICVILFGAESAEDIS